MIRALLHTINGLIKVILTTRYEACKQALKEWDETRHMVPWGVAVVLPVGMVLATLLYHLVEEPARKALRAKES